MDLDPTGILQEIIKHEGECETWAGPAICKRCPLGTKRINGQRVNCWDYVRSLRDMKFGDPAQITAAYKEIAEEELFTTELEKLLK